MKESYINFLESYHAHEQKHSNGSLLDHLYGTCFLLNSWKLPKHVCVAGLFHSVYGNEYFTNGLLALNNRKVLIELIGKKAELLVYYFNICNRIQTIANAKYNLNYITERENNTTVHNLSKTQFADLILIIFANELEQIENYSELTEKEQIDLHELYKTSKPYLNEYAIQTYKDIQSGKLKLH